MIESDFVKFIVKYEVKVGEFFQAWKEYLRFRSSSYGDTHCRPTCCWENVYIYRWMLWFIGQTLGIVDSNTSLILFLEIRSSSMYYRFSASITKYFGRTLVVSSGIIKEKVNCPQSEVQTGPSRNGTSLPSRLSPNVFPCIHYIPTMSNHLLPLEQATFF